jgi:hypothetical protein
MVYKRVNFSIQPHASRLVFSCLGSGKNLFKPYLVTRNHEDARSNIVLSVSPPWLYQEKTSQRFPVLGAGCRRLGPILRKMIMRKQIFTNWMRAQSHLKVVCNTMITDWIRIDRWLSYLQTRIHGQHRFHFLRPLSQSQTQVISTRTKSWRSRFLFFNRCQTLRAESGYVVYRRSVKKNRLWKSYGFQPTVSYLTFLGNWRA